MTQGVETRLDGETLVVRIPMRFQRRGGRKRIVAPVWQRHRSHLKAAAGQHARQDARASLEMAEATRERAP